MIKKAPLWLCEINEDDGKITYYKTGKSAFMAAKRRRRQDYILQHNKRKECLHRNLGIGNGQKLLLIILPVLLNKHVRVCAELPSCPKFPMLETIQ